MDYAGYSSVPMESKRSSRSYTGNTSPGFIDVFENTQHRTFLKWLNTRLESANIPTMKNLASDLSDGVRLCQLMEIMSQTSLGRYNHAPRMRVQKAENVNKALQFIKGSGVVLTNIGPEDIIDGNLKLILGMIWTLILRFTIADINEEGLSAKEGLLLWCQRKTQPYEEVNVQDFSRSWKDGLAFCALIHRHRPDLLDWETLDKTDAHAATRLAFTIAQQHLGIPQLLDVSDICDIEKPDDRSVMTYVAQYFHAFSVMDRTDVLSRRVTMFADAVEAIWTSRNDYERRARELITATHDILTQWSESSLSSTYTEAKQESHDFALYKKTLKRQWVGQKADLAGLLSNISTKLKTYNMKPYIPPPGLGLTDIDNAWQDLRSGEANRSRAINANIREIKEGLRIRYAEAANACERLLQSISVDLASLDGPLEGQLTRIEALAVRVSEVITDQLPMIGKLEQDCKDAGCEESDYTVYTADDLDFEAGLVKEAVAKKKAFVNNQIVARTSTKLTPSQLEEFESTFRHFDKDQENKLGVNEFSAALSALGIIYSDEDTLAIHDQLSQGDEDQKVSFQAWIDFLTDITEDQTSPDQVRESFAGIARGKPYVTELDLQVASIPPQTIAFLKTVMPEIDLATAAAEIDGMNGDGRQGKLFAFDAFLDDAFSM
ncbi:hypothetical protein P389DRAFT_65766 [Cystobasidium minutum MCA 4210]|uniref:uncharacterized protein n=1 Tax=Cystobasidium minutum MCA 4210 TaxID=1397322 RepID=UPI0034CFCB76|eukprot:jgi/Rhomi1/65766/CE65765_216